MLEMHLSNSLVFCAVFSEDVLIDLQMMVWHYQVLNGLGSYSWEIICFATKQLLFRYTDAIKLEFCCSPPGMFYLPQSAGPRMLAEEGYSCVIGNMFSMYRLKHKMDICNYIVEF